MATRTIIDGGKQAITFNNDTEPVAVYVDGELQQNVSFVPQLAQGTGSAQYISEYKKNHIDIEMQGTTSQKQYQGYQQVGFKDFTDSYADTDGNVLNIECKDGIITLNGKTNKRVPFTLNYLNMTNRVLKAGTYTFTTSWVREAGTNGVFGNIGGCDCRFDVASGTPIYSYFGARTVITFETDVTVGYFQPYINFNTEQDLVNTKFAIGVFKGDVATADFPPYEPYVGGIPSPNPQYPQEIENANDVVLLSKDYQQVEYIESTGTQYIDTGVFPTIDTVVEISCLNKSNNKFIYGSRTSAASTDKHCVLFQPSSTDIYALFGSSAVVNSSFISNDNTIYKVKNGKDGCYINDVKIRDYGNASFGYTTLSLYLFAINTPAEDYAERAFVGNIYSCKIYEGKTLVRNFIPCYRKSDNVIGLFELVNGTFYTNQGTGNFNKGIDVSSNVAIKNTLVALHGDNLYNISIVKGATTNINVPDIPRIEQYGSITDGVLHLKYGVYAGGTIWTNAKIRIEKGGKYYVTLDVYVSSETVYKRFVARFHNATKKTTTGFLSFNIREADIWQRYEFFITVPDDWVGDAVYLCLMSGGGAEQYNDVPMYAKNIMITYGEPKDYEPYFREEITIPTSVEVDNGDGTAKTVDLPFTIYDKLVVDRVANTVTYEKKSGVRVFKGNENFDIGTSNVPNAYEYEFPLARAGFNMTTANGYCTHFTPVTAENISKIGDVCFILSPTNRPFMSFVFDDFGYSLSEFELAEEEFESWVAEQYNAGTPLTIVVEYEEVESIDITQSSLAQSLLNLATQNQTNYFEITSNEEAPQVPIKINYAKWGELVENNNNT